MSCENRIPKIIHYCWFGKGEKSNLAKQCISSWKEKLKGYEIIEWNENNYDVNRHTYTAEAYKNRKYGFVTDVARLDILYEHGGIYMDTDVTLLKNLDELLYQRGFIATEKWGNVNTGGGCGFTKGHPILKDLIDYRDKFHFKSSFKLHIIYLTEKSYSQAYGKKYYILLLPHFEVRYIYDFLLEF